MRVYVDATPLYNFGQIGELGLFDTLDGELVIPDTVSREISVEPAATNLGRFLDESDVTTQPPVEDWLDDARALLDAETAHSDAWIVAGLLAARDSETPAVLVSDDRRLRAVADGLGATVTGTFGIVVGAAVDDKYFSTNQAKRVIRRTDHHGIQMTGRLRERAIGEVDS
jgi:predicted nucleic acid-binding protein